MADDAQDVSRVVIRVSPHMQFLLTQLARHLCKTKKDLHGEIWEAGVRVVLGVEPADIEDASVVSLPRSTAAPKDTRKLVAALLSGR